MCSPAAPMDQGTGSKPYWVKTWEGAKEEPQIVVLDKSPYGEGVKGWTICDKDKRACHIILLRNADRESTEAHERKHVSGWDHPDYPRHLSPTDSPLDLMRRR